MNECLLFIPKKWHLWSVHKYIFHSQVDLNLVFCNNDILKPYINIFNLFLSISILGSVFGRTVHSSTEYKQKILVLLW